MKGVRRGQALDFEKLRTVLGISGCKLCLGWKVSDRRPGADKPKIGAEENTLRFKPDREDFQAFDLSGRGKTLSLFLFLICSAVAQP